MSVPVIVECVTVGPVEYNSGDFTLLAMPEVPEPEAEETPAEPRYDDEERAAVVLVRAEPAA